MDVSRPPNIYNNDAFSPSLEMNNVAPAIPKNVPVGGATAASYAVEKFENAHITIFQAARDGRLDIVKKKLARRGQANVNKKDGDNMTALHYAVRFNHVEIVKLLMKKGANPNIPGEDGATPIHYAARYRPLNVLKQSMPQENEVNDNTSENLPTVETQDFADCTDDTSESILSCLVKKSSANLNATDHYGSTPLHYSAQKGNPQAVEELLKLGKVEVNALDKQRATPLHEACTQGNPNVARMLIKNGADLQARDSESMTPIHYAAMNERVDCVKVLVESAEKIGGNKFVEQIICECERERQTALHIAVDAGSRKTAQYLLFKGAQVDAAKMNYATPLHLAATAGDVEIVELLLNFKANVEAKNMNHETPLHKAALFDSVPVIKILLNKGANIEARDKDNYTPLLVAVAHGNEDSVSALLKHNADIRVKESSDRSAIFIAAQENCVDVLELLLKNPSAKRLLEESDRKDNTPLHIASKKGFINAVRLLLDQGADIDATNLEEHTALHLAAKNGKENIVRELTKKDGTIINDEDGMANTALHLASTNGHQRVVELLLDKGATIDARNLLYWTPLDCAALNGWTKSARVLLEFDAPVDPIDKCRVTPLHLAAREGHVDMVRLLMSYHADISLRDSTGRNALDMAIDEGNKPCALAILERDNWRDAMKSKSIEHGIITTPLRKMIVKEPDVAEIVFNKCTELSDHASDSHEFWVKLDYEFLEDIYCKWQEGGDDISLSSEIISQQGDTTSIFGPDGDNTEYESIDFKTAEDVRHELEKKKSHPLMLMVKHGREDLITHPLVVYLLDSKWRMFGRTLFYLKLFFFLFFLTFLTGYVVMATRNSPELAKITPNETVVEKCTSTGEDTLAFKVFVEVGRYILLISACAHLLLEFFQMVYERLEYVTNYTNYIEVSLYISTIIYVAADFDLSFVAGENSGFLSDASCSSWRVNVGALAIFLAWIVLTLFVRKFPMFGIYIVMFEDIMVTFLRFSVILVLFIVAFGLSFYTILHRYHTVSFPTPGLSLLKTFAMVIGEFDYDSIFSENVEKIGHPPAFAYLLFIIFIVVMTILLMNLLVGLAVDDIKEVQAQASLKRQAMLVDLALNVEKAFPRFLRKRFVPKDVVIRHPNWLRERMFTSIDGDTIRERLRQERTPFEKIENRQEEVKETVRKLKGNVNALSARTEHIESMVKAMVEHMQIKVNEDELDEELDD